MLQFFRRYQRFFFLIITIVIVISFTFFGVFPKIGYSQPSHVKEPLAFPHESIDETDFQNLHALVTTHDGGDSVLSDVLGPHALKETFFSDQFLSTHIIDKIGKTFQDVIAQELLKKHENEKQYVPYQHMQVPDLQADKMWQYFYPQLWNHYHVYTESNTDSIQELLPKKVDLFLSESEFPSYLQWQLLQMQQNELKGINPDPYFTPRRLNLFGYNNLEDWFGKPLLELCTHFIWQVSETALQQGYQVSSYEAERELLDQNHQQYQQLSQLVGDSLPSETEFLDYKLSKIGIEKKDAIKAYKRLIVFKRYVDELEKGMLISPLISKRYGQFASDQLHLVRYQLPVLQDCQNFEDCKLLQVYLHAIAKTPFVGKDAFELPKKIRPIAEIEKEFPELIYQNFELEIAHVNQETLALKIPLKEIWDFETDSENFAKLQQVVPILTLANENKTPQEILDNLSSKQRLEVDQQARKFIMESKQEWVKEALDQATPEVEIVKVSKKGTKWPIKGLPYKQVATFLKTLKGESTNLDLNFLSFNQKDVYRIRVVSIGEPQQVLSFREAKQLKVLDSILDRKLETYYHHMVAERDPAILDSKGLIKPFLEMKLVVSNRFFEPLQEAVVNLIPHQSSELLDSMISYRFSPYLEQELQHLTQTNTISHEDWDPLLREMFELQQEEVYVARKDATNSLLELFNLKAGEFSQLRLDEQGHLSFYQLHEKSIESNITDTDFMVNLRAILSEYFRDNWVKETLTQLSVKGHIAQKPVLKDQL